MSDCICCFSVHHSEQVILTTYSGRELVCLKFLFIYIFYNNVKLILLIYYLRLMVHNGAQECYQGIKSEELNILI
jgi:hypothetical protein